MSRSQKSKATRQDVKEIPEVVDPNLISPGSVENVDPNERNVLIAGPSRPKSPRVEGNLLEKFRASLKEEINSEIKTLIIEFQKELMKLLKHESEENSNKNVEISQGNETREF